MLDGHAQRERLTLAGNDHDDLARLEYRLDAHGERHARHGGDVVSEETGVGEYRVVRERLDARARRQRGSRLVERDVAVLANPAKEELDPADGPDLLFVCIALTDKVGRVAVEDVHVCWVNVHCRVKENIIGILGRV